jgi:hypothetical protein
VAFHPYMRSGWLHSDGALVVALLARAAAAFLLLGSPLLMALRILFRLAWLCDVALVFLAGAYLQQFDQALRVWCMWSAVGLLLTFIRGMQA